MSDRFRVVGVFVDDGAAVAIVSFFSEPFFCFFFPVMCDGSAIKLSRRCKLLQY